MNATDKIKNKTWVKVLDKGGNSIHGGSMKWSLPNGVPGEWHEVKGKIECCVRGLHFTSDPKRWIEKDCRFFIAELDFSEYNFENDENDDKICVRKGRLIRECSNEDLFEFGIYMTGSHLLNGVFYAGGNATVKAGGNATVEAEGNATVKAGDNATVKARGNATVEAWGNATVEAEDNATVKARGNATVEAWDSATVEAWGNATVEAWDSATVEARGNATVKARGNATVKARGNATVEAWDSAIVKARGNATVEAGGNAYVLFYNNASLHTITDGAIKKSYHDKKIWIKKGSHTIIEID